MIFTDVVSLAEYRDQNNLLQFIPTTVSGLVELFDFATDSPTSGSQAQFRLSESVSSDNATTVN